MTVKVTLQHGFHAEVDYRVAHDFNLVETGIRQISRYTYSFQNFFHPYVGELIGKLNRESLKGMLDPVFLEGLRKDFFGSTYALGTSFTVRKVGFDKTIDTTMGGPYANYNWEIFFHIPLTIAVHLSKNQRFADAQRWFHFIFDPTATSEDPADEQPHWRFLAFRHGKAERQIDEMLALLSKPAGDCSAEELAAKQQLLLGYEAILHKPFRPHAVARTRQIAYMFNVVMKYLDNLVAWGDFLFRQDTLESINEATQIYVLAANILGERPQRVPAQGTTRPRSFAQLRAAGLDAIGNALVELEESFPFGLGAPTTGQAQSAGSPIAGIARTLYFCVPRNDKLLGYWDIVADRLFKIRNSMNIAGIVRQLALFDPPIDPGMLVKAAAAGIDIGSAVAGLNQPPSVLRALPMIRRATELANEVRALGAALLTALEKGDGERMMLLRQTHEIGIQRMQTDTRFLQWRQAQESTEALLRARAAMLERYRYHLKLLGRTVDDAAVPAEPALDRRALTEEGFDEAHAALVGQYAGDIAATDYAKLTLADADDPGSEAGALGLLAEEKEEMDAMTSARAIGLSASVVGAIANALAFIPDADGDFHFWGMGGKIKVPIGTAISKGVETTARGLQMAADWTKVAGELAGITSRHLRRADEWAFQANLAAADLRLNGRQILGSLISEQVAAHELEMTRKQIENADEVDALLRDKFTNADLYGWMQGELSRLYYEYYRFAFDTARRAETAAKRELMRPEFDGQDYVKFNYWDAGRKGLLSGEALQLDLKRLETAYLEQNVRDYEMTRHVSLMEIDPLELVRLRATGRCTLRLSEAAFDLDGPGHYFRRIRSVALSLPSVTGPYTALNCRLTLVKSSIRISPLGEDYARDGSGDSRFQDHVGGVQSIVASGGEQEGGMFEGPQDERYLPFENAGAISEWQLQLPADPAQGDPATFDYRTIADVILHLRYTAREGGEPLRKAALDDVKTRIEEGGAAGSVRMFSVRHEFPTEWARLIGQVPAPGKRHALKLSLRPEHFPYWSRKRLNALLRVDVLAKAKADAATLGTIADREDRNDGAVVEDILLRDPALDLSVCRLSQIPLPPAPTADGPAEIALYFDSAAFEDLYVAVLWGG